MTWAAGLIWIISGQSNLDQEAQKITWREALKVPALSSEKMNK